jgi:sterol desaturase/sphingolipid hydroxylase (fatty acid hydroxylase superfamily)
MILNLLTIDIVLTVNIINIFYRAFIIGCKKCIIIKNTVMLNGTTLNVVGFARQVCAPALVIFIMFSIFFFIYYVFHILYHVIVNVTK